MGYVIRKAWAKVNGNYSRIISGEPTEALDILTDAYSYKIDLKNIRNDNNEKEILLNKIKSFKQKGFIMTVGTYDNNNLSNTNFTLEEVGLVSSHAYSLLNIKEIHTKKDGIVNLLF